MAKSSERKKKDTPPPEEKVECSMCHQLVPATQTMWLTGRRLCFGCASGWFDEDDPDK